MKKNSIGLPLLVFALFSVAFPFIPASAHDIGEEDPNFLHLLLDQSSDQVNAKLSELEAAGIPIPGSVDLFNIQGKAGYDAALASIEAGNLDVAQLHAFGAMSSFENALGGLFEAEDLGDQVDDNTDEINELVDAISNSESDADELLDLALQNNLDVSFSDYDDAIESAKALLVGGDLEGAIEQFEIAEDLLEDALEQIDEETDLKKDDRVDEFVTSTISQLGVIIEGGNELGLSQSTIDGFQNTLNILQTTESTDEIIAATDQSSDLNGIIQKIKVDILEAGSEFKIKIKGEKMQFGSLDETDIGDILAEIAAATGLTVSELEESEKLKVKEKDGEDDDDGNGLGLGHQKGKGEGHEIGQGEGHEKYDDDIEVNGVSFGDEIHDNPTDNVDVDIDEETADPDKAAKLDAKQAAKDAREKAKADREQARADKKQDREDNRSCPPAKKAKGKC